MSEELYRQEMVHELVIIFASVLTDLIAEEGLDKETVIVWLIHAVICSRLDHPLPDKDAEQLDDIVRILKGMIEETSETSLESQGSR